MLTSRKDEHLSVVLGQRHKKSGKTTGFEAIDFVHCALPEMKLDDVDVSTTFLGKRISAPLLVSSMTGGPKRAASINENLARACEDLRLPFAVGSQRIAIEESEYGGLGRSLRTLAPSVPILGNFGAAQLNLGFGLDEARKAVEMIDADAVYIHLNPLQEAVQPEGDRDWSGLFDKIVALSDALPVPVAIKEVGSGISATLAKRFVGAGITIIDVAGAGGTNWAAVEAARMKDPQRAALANAFSDWGIPTALAVADIRDACPDATVISSGGIRSGIDVAKSIRVGANLAGQAAGLLQAANTSADSLVDHFTNVIDELRICCFCTGSQDLEALRSAEIRRVLG
ncbi:type 2 isopentenyl-diphosphate Delta-isomerase [Hoeflea prorocentri]|uniref:Isopentenyl-diphosphate delta-isomerase n=1 Tax=Hoeflea prorocentri TaxID=1922333 RepID=A0A9X3UFZ5_9HYPH|nr:type 2 isopentenyl-diphosphate Delta-isomerase [Hoeflea prorocentri]MCY6380567.1 type 2 isopentenyl-diphosphate Delta-isomerase [Hoeflea prorocentri]MDA5398367.1 type 2 isopentenyl-diphosphate Delta-isomerase [Hoeflea prorocentri]